MATFEGRPQTEASLRKELAALGIAEGMTLMVHSCLSAIGGVIGGPQTVVRALLCVLGDNGTLAMPAATPQCADPLMWTSPRVPDGWLSEVREHSPLFDVDTTPTTMGAIPEAFRTWPETLRSRHPLESLCSWSSCRGCHQGALMGVLRRGWWSIWKAARSR